MKRKLLAIEFAASFLSLILGVATGISLVGKPLRLVDFILILSLGIAGGALLAKAFIGLQQKRRNGESPRDPGRDA